MLQLATYFAERWSALGLHATWGRPSPSQMQKRIGPRRPRCSLQKYLCTFWVPNVAVATKACDPYSVCRCVACAWQQCGVCVAFFVLVKKQAEDSPKMKKNTRFLNYTADGRSDPCTWGRSPVVLEVLLHSRAISTQGEIVLDYLHYLGFCTVRSGVAHL